MRYSVTTTATVTDVTQRARAAFGASGLGLRAESVSMLVMTYAGSAGAVSVEVRPLGGGLNEVEVASQAFDDEARRFALSLPRPGALYRLRRWIASKVAPRTRP